MSYPGAPPPPGGYPNPNPMQPGKVINLQLYCHHLPLVYS